MPKREYEIRTGAPSKLPLRDLIHCTRIVRIGDAVDPDYATVVNRDIFGQNASIKCRGLQAKSSYSSPVRTCARPLPKLQSASEFVTMETTISFGSTPQLFNSSQSFA
jgi:hypothetical protein